MTTYSNVKRSKQTGDVFPSHKHKRANSKSDSNNEFLASVYAHVPLNRASQHDRPTIVYSTPGALGVSTKLNNKEMVALYNSSSSNMQTAGNQPKRRTSQKDIQTLQSRERRSQITQHDQLLHAGMEQYKNSTMTKFTSGVNNISVVDAQKSQQSVLSNIQVQEKQGSDLRNPMTSECCDYGTQVANNRVKNNSVNHKSDQVLSSLELQKATVEQTIAQQPKNESTMSPAVMAISNIKSSQRVVISQNVQKRETSNNSNRVVSRMRGVKQATAKQSYQKTSSPSIRTNTDQSQQAMPLKVLNQGFSPEQENSFEQKSGAQNKRRRGSIRILDQLEQSDPLPKNFDTNNTMRSSFVNGGNLDEPMEKQEVVIEKLSRGVSRQKGVLSPLQQRPVPLAGTPEQTYIKQQICDPQIKISSPGIPKHSANMKLKPLQQSLQKKGGLLSSAINSIEQITITDCKQNQLATEDQNEKSVSPTKTIQKNALQTITNWDNYYGYQSIHCQSQNAEPFIRRAVQRMGWTEVSQVSSNKPGGGFHIRFNISDLEGQTSDLSQKHFYNHHPTNRELTTKSGLCKNLWQGCFDECQYQIQTFFPRCYDLSDLKQCQDFKIDFYRTACLSVIRIVARHFLSKFKHLDQLYTDFTKRCSEVQSTKVLKQKFKQKCAQLDIDLKLQKTKIFNGQDQIRNAYNFAKGYLQSHQFQDLAQKKKVVKVPSDDQQTQLTKYHKQLLSPKGAPLNIVTYEQYKLVRVYRQLEDVFPQFNSIDGKHNLWIVKPSYNARGFGIFCSRDINDIMPDMKKGQQKVVQKYIEVPMLLDQKPYVKRKFDFRQWVLVLSWEPLDVLVFDACYLKICGQEFDLAQHEDTLRHLSNYSLQQKAGEKKELVMSSDEFQTYMRSTGKNQDFQWSKDMLPKINSVVWRSLKSIQETQETRPNSFEIYGFDIVLDDQELNPWVIEINLSPACAERQEWLTKMLDDSALDLLNYLQSKIILTNAGDHWAANMKEKVKPAKKSLKEVKGGLYLNTEEFYKEQNLSYKWVRLPESQEEIRLYNNIIQYQLSVLNQQNQQPLDLQIQVAKVDQRIEKKIDRQYQTELSTLIIQSLYRGHVARKTARSIRRYNATLKIQSFARMFFAIWELKRLQRQKAAIRLQRWSKKCIAKSELEYLKVLDRSIRKRRLATKLQALWRRKKAIKLLKQLRLQKNCLMLQAMLRGRLARKSIRQMMSERCKMVLIQRFYKRRYKRQQNSSILLQSKLRGYLSNKKSAKLLHFSQACTKSESLIRRSALKNCLSKFVEHRNAILLQRNLRVFLARKAVANLRKARSRKQVYRIARKIQAREIRKMLSEVKAQMQIRAVLVQTKLRGYLAKKKVEAMYKQIEVERIFQRQKQVNDCAAIVLQKQMRRRLAQKRVELMRIQDGAVVMIQAMFRGFKQRKLFLELQQKKKKSQQKKSATPQKQSIHSEHNKTPSEKESGSKKPKWSRSRQPNGTHDSYTSNANILQEHERQKALRKEAIKHAQAVLDHMQSQRNPSGKDDIWNKFQKKKKSDQQPSSKFKDKSINQRDTSRPRKSEDVHHSSKQRLNSLGSDRQSQIQSWYNSMTPNLKNQISSKVEKGSNLVSIQDVQDQTQIQASQYFNSMQQRKKDSPMKSGKNMIVSTTELNFAEHQQVQQQSRQSDPNLLMSQTMPINKKSKTPILAIVQSNGPIGEKTHQLVKPQIIGQPVITPNPESDLISPKQPHFPVIADSKGVERNFQNNLQDLLHSQNTSQATTAEHLHDQHRGSAITQISSESRSQPKRSSVLKDKLTSYLITAGSQQQSRGGNDQVKAVELGGQEKQQQNKITRADQSSQINQTRQERAKRVEKAYALPIELKEPVPRGQKGSKPPERIQFV